MCERDFLCCYSSSLIAGVASAEVYSYSRFSRVELWNYVGRCSAFWGSRTNFMLTVTVHILAFSVPVMRRRLPPPLPLHPTPLLQNYASANLTRTQRQQGGPSGIGHIINGGRLSQVLSRLVAVRCVLESLNTHSRWASRPVHLRHVRQRTIRRIHSCLPSRETFRMFFHLHHYAEVAHCTHPPTPIWYDEGSDWHHFLPTQLWNLFSLDRSADLIYPSHSVWLFFARGTRTVSVHIRDRLGGEKIEVARLIEERRKCKRSC